MPELDINTPLPTDVPAGAPADFVRPEIQSLIRRKLNALARMIGRNGAKVIRAESAYVVTEE